MLGDHRKQQSDEGDMNSVLLHGGDNMVPDEVKVPKAPDDWVYPPPNIENGEPNCDKVDDPWVWITLYYLPVLSSGAQGGQYKYHCLPSRCQPVFSK